MSNSTKRPSLSLSPEDRKGLYILARSRTAPAREVQRAKILLAYADSTPISTIGETHRTCLEKQNCGKSIEKRVTYPMYPSDLSDKEWDLIKDYFVRKDPRGCKPQHDKRTIVNAIFYLNKGGIQWRMLPKDFPPWKTVYDYFRLWSRAGLWERILDFLNTKYRQQEGRKPMPTYS